MTCTREKIVTSAALLDDLLELVREDAEYFDSNAEVDHARTILARGTSADRQLCSLPGNNLTVASPLPGH